MVCVQHTYTSFCLPRREKGMTYLYVCFYSIFLYLFVVYLQQAKPVIYRVIKREVKFKNWSCEYKHGVCVGFVYKQLICIQPEGVRRISSNNMNNFYLGPYNIVNL